MLSVLPAGIRVPSSRRYSRGRRRDQINSQTFFPTERGKGEGEERKEKKGVKREECTDYKTLGWRANEGVRVFSFPLFLCERERKRERDAGSKLGRASQLCCVSLSRLVHLLHGTRCNSHIG